MMLLESLVPEEGQAWDLYVRWLRQYTLLQQSQVNGKKSCKRQDGSEQRAPTLTNSMLVGDAFDEVYYLV